MKKMNIQTKKDVVKKGALEETVLIELYDDSELDVKLTPPELNIAIAIDVSGSMSSPVNRKAHPFYHFKGRQKEVINSNPESRIEQAIKVAKKTLDNMKNGDYISIIAFNQEAKTIIESVKLTAENRENIRNKIENLNASGMTDLYSGWLESIEQISTNMKQEGNYINRVLLLSDGDITYGVNDSQKICQNVDKIARKGVSLTTFGIGEDFNEDLLQQMAVSGQANSYYIDDADKMEQVFQDEFNDFTSISGRNVRITFETSDGVEVSENTCDFAVVDGNTFSMPNIRRTNKVYGVFKLKAMKAVTSGAEADFGKVKLTYMDNEGCKQEEVVCLKREVVDRETYEKAEENQEVYIQEILMETAKMKKEATKKIDNNDKDSAKEMMLQGLNELTSQHKKYGDDRLFNSIEGTKQVISMSEEEDVSSQALRKTISYQGYSTTRSII